MKLYTTFATAIRYFAVNEFRHIKRDNIYKIMVGEREESNMSILSALNNIANGKKNPAALSREEIVELLKTSPEKLEAFEN